MKLFGNRSKSITLIIKGSTGRFVRRLTSAIYPLSAGEELNAEEENSTTVSIKTALKKRMLYEELTDDQLENLKKLSIGVHTATKTHIRQFAERFESKYTSLALEALWSLFKDAVAVVSQEMGFKAKRMARIEAVWPMFKEIMPQLDEVNLYLLSTPLGQNMNKIRRATKSKTEPLETAAEPKEEEFSQEETETETETETEEVAVEA